MLRKYIDYIQPQRNIECCTACATLLAAEITMAVAGRRLRFSRLYLYYMTRSMQNTLGIKGAKLKSTLDALSKYGVALEKNWGFMIHKENIEPPKQVIEEAIRHRLESYKEISHHQYKEYLDQYIPIIVGIQTGKLFWELAGPLEEQQYKPINGSDNKQTTGHAITIVGYNNEINGGSWIIANSLGPKWGHKGYAAIPYTCNQDIGESYIINSFAGISAGKKFQRFDK